MAAPEQPDDQQLARIHNALAKSPLCHVVNVLKTGLATVPFCGGIASLMTDYIPSARMTRLEQFAKDLARDLTMLQDQVCSDRLQTQEYAYLFEQCFRGVATHYQDEKIRAFRGILVNAATADDPPQAEREFLLGLVDRLSVLHMKVLNLLATYDGARNDLLIDAMREEATEASDDVLWEAILDSVRLRLVRTQILYLGEGPPVDKMSFNNTELTPLGSRFVEFCTVPEA